MGHYAVILRSLRSPSWHEEIKKYVALHTSLIASNEDPHSMVKTT